MGAGEVRQVLSRRCDLINKIDLNILHFSWLKNFKRIMVRYDRLTSTFTGFILLGFFHIIGTKLDNKDLVIYE